MIDLRAKPFFLNDEQIEWVNHKLVSMDINEKIGQMFCPIGHNTDADFLADFAEKYKPGAMLFRPMPSAKLRVLNETMQRHSDIPMLFGANIESGGNGVVSDGTYYCRPMGVAASDNTENAYQLGVIAAREAAAVGCNWAFAPVCDLDLNWQNPIENVRTFGSDKNRVTRMTLEQMRGLRDNGVAAAVKHFPGDGVDFRDSHLLPSVNSLSADEWSESYGEIWKEVIEAGTLSIMAGHILLPAWSKKINPDIRDEEIYPASLSCEIINGLLRDRMGFNGVVITDATPMIGYNTPMKRRDAIPQTINAGCDMILFNKDIDEDYAFLKEAIEDGRLAIERVDDAVTRILAMKAAMRLPEARESGELYPSEETLSIISCPEHLELARKVADESITLVKDTQGLLPISSEKYKRIRLYLLEDRSDGGFGGGGSAAGKVKEKLEAEGFEVNLYDYSKPDFHEMFDGGVEDIKSKFDLAIYVACIDTASNQSVRRIDWLHLMAADAPWFVNEVPAMFISLANPYHLVDAPMIKTYINAYTPTEAVVDKVMDKIMGRSDFKGISPVDPFCGIWGARF